MLRKSFLVFFVILSLVFLQAVISNMAQTSQTLQSKPEVRPFTDLTLEISSSKDSLVPLQPIPIIIKQSNKTNQPILGYNAIGFGLSPLFLYVQKSGTTEKIQVQMLSPIQSFGVYKNTEIAPGDTREGKEWLTVHLDKYFSEPGTYQLQMLLVNPDRTQRVESNTINIEIREPVGIDREVYNLIKNSSAHGILFSGLDFRKAENTLETIATKFPNSAYAKSSFYLLGQINFFRKQYPKALGHLIKLVNDKDFIFAEKVKNYLDEIRESQNQPQEQQ